MNAHRWIFLGVCLSGIAMTVAPAGASCPVPPTLEERFAHTPTVFVGRAIAQQIVPWTSRLPAGTRATETTFDVEELWKGQPTATLRILNCGWQDADQTVTCSDFKFVVGSRYVVFAAGDPLETNECFPTALVDQAGETLKGLAGKPLKKAG
jgi:hypothetical protein